MTTVHPQGDFETFVADSLVRCLNEFVPRDADSPARRERYALSALAAWGAHLGKANDAGFRGVWDALRDEIVNGWLPADRHDPLLVAALAQFDWRLELEESPHE